MKKIELVTTVDLEARLRPCLERRYMPDCFLYLGPAGVASWLELSNSQEFPVATRLTHLLRYSIPFLVQHVAAWSDVVSVGVGSGEKERLLLEALGDKCINAYYAVDISSDMVEKALDTVAHLDVDKAGVVAFLEDLPQIRRLWKTPVVLCLLGNTFCNYEPEDILTKVRSVLTPADLFLFDCNLLGARSNGEEQAKQAVEQVYRSRQNVSFNLGPLVERGLRPDDCDFHLDLVEADTSAGTLRRTSKSIQILRDTDVWCGDSAVRLAAGDIIQLGFTYKYTRAQVECYLERHGFRSLEMHASPSGDNLLALVRGASV